jgi:hypothetical protein
MPLDLLGLSEVLKKMPLLRKVYLVEFDLRRLKVKAKSEAKMSALLYIALIEGNWLVPKSRGLVPTSC